MEKIKVDIVKLTDDAILPEYATEGSAGMDLYACLKRPVILNSGQISLISTGIAISIPSAEYVGLIYARSGLAIKHGIALANSVGVIDSDYRGEIKVGLINLGKNDYIINPKDRIAQLVFSPVFKAELCLKDRLDNTIRGKGGFGSTGK